MSTVAVTVVQVEPSPRSVMPVSGVAPSGAASRAGAASPSVASPFGAASPSVASPFDAASPTGAVSSGATGDSADFSDFVGLVNALDRHEVGDRAAVRPVETVALGWRRPTSRTLGLLARDAHTGEAAGMARVVLPERDNTHLLDVELYVSPEHRGRGHGRALLEAVESAARVGGRDTLLVATTRPVSPVQAWALHDAAVREPMLSRTLDPGEEAPGVRFARAAGFAVVQSVLRSEVRLPADGKQLAAAEAEASDHATGYGVVTWRGRPPPELLADRALLAERMSTDPPLGEVDWREEQWDVARIEASYDDEVRRGVEIVGAGAVEERTGRLVAFSEIAVDPAVGSPGFQEDTIVDPAHRGHRLGLLVKAANLHAVAAVFPALDRVLTYNALENGPMLRVNRAVGFEPVVLHPLWQRKLAGL